MKGRRVSGKGQYRSDAPTILYTSFSLPFPPTLPYVSTKVVLHALAAVNKKVVVRVVVARAIVIVNVLLRRVVVDQEAKEKGGKGSEKMKGLGLLTTQLKKRALAEMGDPWLLLVVELTPGHLNAGRASTDVRDKRLSVPRVLDSFEVWFQKQDRDLRPHP